MERFLEGLEGGRSGWHLRGSWKDCGLVDGLWMDGWMDGWMGCGWMDGWVVDGWMDGLWMGCG